MTGFTGPSGRKLSDDDINLLCDLERNRTIEWTDREVKFNSGFMSNVYVRARNDLALNPKLLHRVAQKMKGTLDDLPHSHGPQRCLIGIPTAGYQLAQAISHLSVTDLATFSAPHCFCMMRTVPKDHGVDQTLIDPPNVGLYSYATVENVISTAKAMLGAFENLEVAGYPVREMHHIVFADWQLGGVEILHEKGFTNVHTCFIMRDVIAAYVHKGLWPPERYDLMNHKIFNWNN